MAQAPAASRPTVGEAIGVYLRSVDGQLAPTTVTVYRGDLEVFAHLVGSQRILDDISGIDLDDAIRAYARTPDGRLAVVKATAEATPSPVGDGNGRLMGAPLTRRRPPPTGGDHRDPAQRSKDTKSPRTVARWAGTVQRFFAEAVRQGWVVASPFQWATQVPRTSQLPERRAVRNALPAAKAGELLLTARDRTSAPADGRADQDLALRDALIVALLAVHGPRVAELVGANLDDVTAPDGDGGQARWLVRGKGNKTRIIPLAPPAWDLWQAYLLEGRPSPTDDPASAADAQRALLLSWRGKRLTPNAVRGIVQRATTETHARTGTQPHVTPHGLRHTAASVLVAYGTPLPVVRDLLGHANISTTNEYLEAEVQQIAEATRHHPLLGALQ